MTRIVISSIMLALILVGPVDAQDRWGMELRAAGAVPTADLGPAELDTGFGFDATLSYRFLPHLAAYAGWDWIHFGSTGLLAGTEADIEETGYVFGLRYEHPLRGEARGPLAAWLRAGATYDHIEVEASDGELLADSGHGFGWEAGAGLAIALGDAWSLTPGFRYRSLSRDLDVASAMTDADLRYASFEVGVQRLF